MIKSTACRLNSEQTVLVLGIVIFLIFQICDISQIHVYGQSGSSSIEEQLKSAAQTSANPHFETVFKQKLGANYTTDLEIIYQSPTMVVLRGELYSNLPQSSLFASVYNNGFWRGIEILKREYGFTLDKFVVNGIGSELNADRFYAIMTKGE